MTIRNFTDFVPCFKNTFDKQDAQGVVPNPEPGSWNAYPCSINDYKNKKRAII